MLSSSTRTARRHRLGLVGRLGVVDDEAACRQEWRGRDRGVTIGVEGMVGVEVMVGMEGAGDSKSEVGRRERQRQRKGTVQQREDLQRRPPVPLVVRRTDRRTESRE